MSTIKVLIVDDSALVRKVLTEIISHHPKLEVIGTASDPYMAVNKIKSERPDVITLDVEMPKMDGITFLQRIMAQHPIPVVIISSLTARGSETALRALEAGAVEIITKPELQLKEFFDEYKVKLHDKIIAASVALLRKRKGTTEKLSASSVVREQLKAPVLKTTEKIIVVGASTGGTEALKVFLEVMPPDCPGIVIVQHMPEMFTKQFAQRLNSLCAIRVKEGEHGDTILRGQAIIAPGNKHMLLKRSGARYYIEINDGPLVNRHRPAVDVLFRTAAQNAGRNAVGVIMTGMGDDGARGMKELKEAGAYTIAQDEASCVVFGMPKEAIKLDAVDKIMPLKNIAPAALLACK